MTTSTVENAQKVVRFVQEFLRELPDLSEITPGLIEQQIDLVLAMKPAWGTGLDRTMVVDELIRRFSLWIGSDTSITDNTDHVAWLDSTRKRDWRYWQRYAEWMERSLSPIAVEGLDRSTDRVLGLIEDPLREGSWDRRGLVVGHVQSGKTGHYTGLITKAADAGYKIIIVLAGLHNNLRAQTQVRLDEGFLGYETHPNAEHLPVVGVGEIDADPSIRPNYATNRSDTGDFSTAASRNIGISPEQRPWLFVVKKNKAILERLLRWIRNRVANSVDESGRKIVSNLPLLLIDDEADHASVDTGEGVLDDKGNPDVDHDPKPINRAIRQILISFTRRAYVGYTATPFANIFIHDRGHTDDEGPDLFPSAFIVNLSAPSNYVGPARVFGTATRDGRVDGLPLIRPVTDNVTKDGLGGWMPPKHKISHLPMHEGKAHVPPSLASAIDSFLLVCAIRRARGQGREHCSMLVHVTRFTAVQDEVRRQVEAHVTALRQRLLRRIGHEDAIARLRGLFDRDFSVTTSAVRAARPDWVMHDDVAWPDIEPVLAEVVSDVLVRTINGSAKDALDYVEHAATGLKVIAIGGDKLSRGLTLEGLCTSYFVRTSKMYDTLMQMGRWFGYRPGYIDLCRLYMPDELKKWFEHITDAADELREEFDAMAAAGATPIQFGLKVASHPSLLVTSPLKMRAAGTLHLSFSGEVLETISLFGTRSELQENLDATTRFLSGIGKAPSPVPARRRGIEREDRWDAHQWEGVPADQVIAFLTEYRTHRDARKVQGLLIGDFIGAMAAAGELTSWTVVLLSGGSGDERLIASSLPPVRMYKRSGEFSGGKYSIGRLLDPKDEAIDLDGPAWDAALAATRRSWAADPGRNKGRAEPELPSGPAIRKIRGLGAEGVPPHPERGLLLIYALDPARAGGNFPEDTPPIIALGISFPGSNQAKTVPYRANNVLIQQWALDYGPST